MARLPLLSPLVIAALFAGCTGNIDASNPSSKEGPMGTGATTGTTPPPRGGGGGGGW